MNFAFRTAIRRFLTYNTKDYKLQNNVNKSRTARVSTSDSLGNVRAKEIKPLDDYFQEIGENISGRKITDIRAEMLNKLNQFYQSKPIREIAETNNIDSNIFTKAFLSFRRYCYKSESLPPELYLKFCDIVDNKAHISDLFPFFLTHCREAFPHLECKEELKKISDLGLPHIWYPEARQKPRKIVCHIGPTNSGKTYHAMKSFLKAKSGIYCGPLKLLASEIYEKTNANNVPCDLLTGDDRRMANPDGETKSKHISCTVEMTPIQERVEVAVIDEIQMLRDPQRGSAWTRALLGTPADEIHLCGEEAALDLIKWMLLPTEDTIEVIRYKRLSPLIVEDTALNSFENLRPGDCIVCFNKDMIYKTCVQLDKLNLKHAVVYGHLPPLAKKDQCQRFNEFKDDCKYLVATDAIGMGLNLKIRRIIFTELQKLYSDEHGVKTMNLITTSQCLQIAGRAGRFGHGSETGLVTTLHEKDLPILKDILKQPVPPITRAGLHPTADQIELFAYHLPHLDMNELINLFIDLCEYDSSGYFICDMEIFKYLAEKVQHINISLRDRYVFCSAPVDIRQNYLVTMFQKMVRQYSCNEPITCDWLCKQLNWPAPQPKSMAELRQLETVYDVFEIYLWLSYRFPMIFNQPEEVRQVRDELDWMINEGITSMATLRKISIIKLGQR